LKYRFTWTTPIVFSPQNPRLIYYGAQYLLETTDEGSSWHKGSPDLTVRPGTEGQTQRGVIYTIAPSALKAGEIWVGTDNGLIQLTLDGGKTWKNVTPEGLTEWSKISLIEASHFDPATAFAAVDRHRLGDIHPYIYVTHNYGANWTQIINGIAPDTYVHAVREDTARRDLLFAGTETGIYVSFDDGAQWESLQLNLPTVAVRDMAIEQGDLVAATHGRGFWVLDDISPLRQLTAQIETSNAYLFKPRLTYRFRRSTNNDTPLPPEEPQGQNPPSGAIVYYWLKSAPTGPVMLEVLDSSGKVVRRYSSAAPPTPPDMNDYAVAPYWGEPPQALSAQAGMHRFVWDLHYARPHAVAQDFPIAAVPHETPLGPRGPLAVPGRYTVRLTVNGATETQSFDLRMDPNVKVSQANLEAQLALGLKITSAMDRSHEALDQVKAMRKRLDAAHSQKGTSAATKALEAKMEKLATGSGSFEDLNTQLGTLLDAVESADVAPTVNAQDTWAEVEGNLRSAMAEWNRIRESEGAAGK
jgi:hypothetical protein